jgi:hypothetical protein
MAKTLLAYLTHRPENLITRIAWRTMPTLQPCHHTPKDLPCINHSTQSVARHMAILKFKHSHLPVHR